MDTLSLIGKPGNIVIWTTDVQNNAKIILRALLGGTTISRDA